MNKNFKIIIRDISVFAFILLVYFVLLGFVNIKTRCIFKMVTGIPCPSCGMTRSYISLLHGNIYKAFFYHPLFLIPIILFIMYILKEFSSIIKKIYSSKYLWIIITILFIIVYIIRMNALFPNKAPMNTYKDAIIPHIIQFSN